MRTQPIFYAHRSCVRRKTLKLSIDSIPFIIPLVHLFAKLLSTIFVQKPCAQTSYILELSTENHLFLAAFRQSPLQFVEIRPPFYLSCRKIALLGCLPLFPQNLFSRFSNFINFSHESTISIFSTLPLPLASASKTKYNQSRIILQQKEPLLL